LLDEGVSHLFFCGRANDEAMRCKHRAHEAENFEAFFRAIVQAGGRSAQSAYGSALAKKTKLNDRRSSGRATGQPILNLPL